MGAKRFFYVCAGIFLLALSYHLGARSAGAQAPGNPVVAVASSGGGCPLNSCYTVVMANGDLWTEVSGGPWQLMPGPFSGPSPAQHESWGAMKSRYRGERGAAQPAQDK